MPKEIKDNLSELESKFLTENGIDIEDKDALNKALFYSVKSGNATLPLFLLKLGADVNYTEKNIPVLAAAMVNGNETLIPILTYLSTPETCRKTVETNRELVDRLEDKVDYLKETVFEMGQQDVNDLKEQWEKAKIEMKKAEEERKHEEEKRKNKEDELFIGKAIFSPLSISTNPLSAKNSTEPDLDGSENRKFRDLIDAQRGSSK